MKTRKIYFGITLGVFLMTTVIAFANNTEPIDKNKKNSTAETVNENPLELNKEYVTMVHENSTYEVEKYLSGLISEWDVLNSEKFDSRKSEFKVVFKSNKGYANVTYDNKGRIVKVKKYLKNVRIPIEIHRLVSKNHEDWSIVQNKYNISYKTGDEVSRSYVLTLQNGTDKKRIRLKV